MSKIASTSLLKIQIKKSIITYHDWYERFQGKFNSIKI